MVLRLEVEAECNIIAGAEEVDGVVEDNERGSAPAMKRGLNKKCCKLLNLDAYLCLKF